MFWFLLLSIIIVLVLVICSYKKKYHSIKPKMTATLNCTYSCDEGNFKIDGTKDMFIIDKNSKYEFLVKNGQIVACKDKNVSLDFVYYGVEA